MAKQIDRQYERRWTAILPALGDLLHLNPMNLIASLFGGGSFRDVDLRIADLQVRVSDLIRRRAELTVRLHDQVLSDLLDVERRDRQIALLTSQLTSHRQRVGVMEAGYRFGQGSTPEMISLWQQSENLQAKLIEAQVSREQSIRRLLALTGYEIPETNQLPAAGDHGDDRDSSGGQSNF